MTFVTPATIPFPEAWILLSEQILGVVNSSDTHRVVLVLRDRREKPFELRTETFSSDVGWYSQQSLELTRAEFTGLKNVLGVPVSQACCRTLADLESAETGDECPSILSFQRLAKRA